MIKRLLKFIPVFVLLLSACNQAPNELRLAEQVMETSPDSALHILQHIQAVQTMSVANRAWYGLLYFEALDKNNKPLQPDSLISFSLNYYQSNNKKNYLASCYYYKARITRYAQRFDDATVLYLKALDLTQDNKENYSLLGKIYSDMGDICAIQMDYNESLRKYLKSINYFSKAGNTIEKGYRIISVGRIYHFQKKFIKAHEYYRRALSQTTDSLLQGLAFQEIGINYYWAKQYDSAQNYIRKSLEYPYKGTNYAIRCFNLADLMYEIGKLDSAATYALISLKYPGTYYNRRDCYRILTNCEYWKNNTEQMGKYMNLYQNYSDSVRAIEIQSKASVLENLHNNNQETTGTKRNMVWTVSMLFIVVMFSAVIVYLLIQRNNLRKTQLDIYKQELNQKQKFVNQNLSMKITETREAQAEARKNASPEERTRLDKELYQKCLHLDNWEAFSREMNHAFNQIVDVLQSDYSGITRKEIIWCCLHLLDVPNADRIMLLNATTDSIYKLKQRLAQKMNLKSTKELDAELKRISSLAV